jgi:LPS export ABC transporter protein LptC
MQLGSAHFTQSEEGVKKWDLVADDVKYFKGDNQMLLTRLKVSYFPKQNEPVVIESKEGRFNSKSGDIEVFGDVIVRSAGGDTLSTDVLKYSPDSELVTTDEEITLKSGSTTIKGKGLSMDIKNNRVVIKSDVDVMFYNSQLRN